MTPRSRASSATLTAASPPRPPACFDGVSTPGGGRSPAGLFRWLTGGMVGMSRRKAVPPRPCCGAARYAPESPEEVMTKRNGDAALRVYVQTNDASSNGVLSFDREADGRLAPLDSFATGGRGTGRPHLPSQSSIVLTGDGRRLVVVNAGSDDLSLFAVGDDGLHLADRVPSGGETPTSVAVFGDLVYALNNGTPNIAGFTIDGGRLAELEGSTRQLSADEADPAQVAF